MSSILLTNARIWDARPESSPDAPPLPGELLVEGNRIAALARAGERIDRSRAEQVIDCAGQFLMPGLVEGHAHLSFVGIAQNKELGEIPVEEHLLRTCRNATLLLDHGFTSAYSAASAKLRLDVVVRNEIEAGLLAGPRLKAASPEITVTAGLGDERRLHLHAESFGMIADGPDEIRRAVRLCAREGVDTIKINISGDDFVPHAKAAVTAMSHAEIAAAVETAHDFGKRVSSHSRAAESVKRAVRLGVDCIYHCESADAEAIDLLEAAKDRIFVGPAVGLLYNCVHDAASSGMSPESVRMLGLDRGFERTCETYRELRKRGVRIVVGGDYGFAMTPMGQNARDIGHFVRFFGFTPGEALVAATRTGGELMGHPGEIGVLQAGAFADLLLVDGDPLADPSVLVGPTRLKLIMKDGRLHKDPRRP
ncbi:MAG: amidohydrolase family protein [Lautropia sp.]